MMNQESKIKNSAIALTVVLSLPLSGLVLAEDVVPGTTTDTNVTPAATEENLAPQTETPVAETPVAETPVAETPVAETPVAETPVTETPVAETPVAETPVAETPVTETPVTETPVTEAVPGAVAGEKAEPMTEADTKTPAMAESTDKSDQESQQSFASVFDVDTSNWSCGFCALEEGWSNEVEIGIGNVSEQSYKFGEFNGLYEDGAFAIFNSKTRYRDLDANYFDLNVSDLGLDSRSVEIKGGKQGSYGAYFRYDEIFHAISDSTSTPYLGNGSDNLTLPSGWVDGSSTTAMTALDSSLQNVEVSLQRKRMDIGVSFLQSSNWKYDVKFRREVREGTKPAAGAFFVNAAQLIEPVDYITDEIDVSASYVGKRWQATLGYYGSFFTNDTKSLTWENAYIPLVAGADTGQRALPPDNLFHQLIFNGGYQLTDKTRISGDISVGRMQQDDDFLDFTTNQSLVVSALPRDSAEAEVNILHANLRIISAINDKLRLSGDINYYDHDNQTPQSQYAWVTTDYFVNTPETNQPYSFTRQELKLGGDYRFSITTKLAAGFDLDRMERTHQEAKQTDENTLWGKLTIRGKDFMDMTFNLAQSERDVSSYQVVSEIDPPQNPLLRKYNMADRSRTTAGATVNAMLSEAVNAGVSIEYSKDDYSESSVGLVEANELNINLDGSYMLSESASIHAFVSQENIDSTQHGSSIFSAPNWSATNDDTVNTFGVGYKHRLMEDMLDIGIDLMLSNSTGSVEVYNQSFPDLEVDLTSIKLYADYRMQDNMSLHAAYWHESYDTRDWALDNVEPDTVSNVLGFGELSPNYDVNVITVSLRYKF